MNRHRFFNVARPGLLGLLAVVCVAAAAFGGFELRVERPTAAAGDAVLLVRAYGCHQPSKARVSGTAEGIARGARRTVPLKLTKVDEGVYAVAQQWPAEGAWVLTLTGTYRGRVSSLLVELDASGQVTADAASQVVKLRRPLTDADVAGALQKVSHATARAVGS